MTTDTAVMPVSTTFPSAAGYLTIITTGEAAARPDGKNLLMKIDIDLDHATATFHGQVSEHVGTHKPRKVTFQADKNCTLEFDNVAVFETKFLQLTANKPKTLEVAKGAKNMETGYRIPAPTAQGARVAAFVMNAPKIVVP